MWTLIRWALGYFLFYFFFVWHARLAGGSAWRLCLGQVVCFATIIWVVLSHLRSWSLGRVISGLIGSFTRATCRLIETETHSPRETGRWQVRDWDTTETTHIFFSFFFHLFFFICFFFNLATTSGVLKTEKKKIHYMLDHSGERQSKIKRHLTGWTNNIVYQVSKSI